MLDPDLLEQAVLHLIAGHRDHRRLLGGLKSEYLRSTLHSVELERREPLWEDFADAVNEVSARSNGGSR